MLLRLFVTVSLRKINEDNLNERDNYGVPFSKKQYTYGSFISLYLNINLLISLIPPNRLKFQTFSQVLSLVSITRQMPRPRHKKQSDYKLEQSFFTLIALF